jgi:DNA-binding transcriptional MerR regulator
MSIGEVARRSGTPITTLRFYERSGLIDPPPRAGGQRRYEPSVLMRLMVIRFCRISGLSIDDIRTVVTDRTSNRRATKQIVRQHIETIDRQLAQLELSRRMMTAALDCVCPTVDSCSCGAMHAVIATLRQSLDSGVP